MNEELVKEKKKEFEEAGNRNGFFAVMAALAGGAPESMVDKYMKPQMSEEKLLEILAAIQDQVPPKVMDVLAGEGMTEEDMKKIRLSFRNDIVINTLAEEVNSCYEGFRSIPNQEELAESLKNMADEMKKAAKKIGEIQKTVDELRMMQDSEKVNEKERRNADKYSEEKEEIPGIKKEDAMEAAEQGKEGIRGDIRIYGTDTDCMVEEEPERNNLFSILGYFRNVSRRKLIEPDARAAEIKKILKKNPSAEQIGALTEALRQGVSADFLQYYADSNASPKKLSGITKLYRVLYDRNYAGC